MSVYVNLSRIFLINIFCAGKRQRGRLVNWVEKASFKKIKRLLEIFEQERHHKILSVNNLRELSRNPSSYNLPVIPLPFPIEIVEGEHFVIADLLSLAPGSSSPTKNPETETVGRELVISTQSRQPSLAREDSGLVSRASKKDNRGSRLERLPFTKKGSLPAPQASKKGRQAPEWLRASGAGVEDFVPWVSPISSRPLLVKRKKRRTRWLTSFINLAHGSANVVPSSSGWLMLPSRWLVKLITTQPTMV